MYLADYHTHSSVSPDGSVTVSELAGAAIDRGLNEICVTDHVDTVLWGSHLPRTSFDWAAVARQVAEARQRCGDRLTIRMRRSWTSSSGRYTWPEKNFTILTYITLKNGTNRIIIAL